MLNVLNNSVSAVENPEMLPKVMQLNQEVQHIICTEKKFKKFSISGLNSKNFHYYLRKTYNTITPLNRCVITDENIVKIIISNK